MCHSVWQGLARRCRGALATPCAAVLGLDHAALARRGRGRLAASRGPFRHKTAMWCTLTSMLCESDAAAPALASSFPSCLLETAAFACRVMHMKTAMSAARGAVLWQAPTQTHPLTQTRRNKGRAGLPDWQSLHTHGVLLFHCDLCPASATFGWQDGLGLAGVACPRPILHGSAEPTGRRYRRHPQTQALING